MRLRAASRAVRFILRHPLGRQDRRGTLIRYVRWQLGSRLLRDPVAVVFIDGTRMLVRTGLSGATGNIYVGLQELEPMGFTLHVLRSDDLLLDVGANVGTYTLLAAGARHAHVIAFEPVHTSAEILSANVRLNGLSSHVDVRRQAVGSHAGRVLVTTDRDTTNRVVSATAPTHEGDLSDSAEVEVVRLDDHDLLRGQIGRILLKVDVEGYETEVMAGAQGLLADGRLIGVIIEINGSGNAFGHSDQQIIDQLHDVGLTEVSYDPISRELREGTTTEQTRIFIRDLDEVRRRVVSADRSTLGTGVTI